MKAIIFFMIVSGLVDAQAPATSSEKDRAIAISSELKAVAQGGDASDAQWNAIDDEIDDYQKTFGVNPKTTHNVVLLRQTELAVAMRSGNDTLVKKLAADPQPEVAALVARIADLKTKPLDLKFTALDGRAVDFASLRGKVVLLDFWATWCGPCVEEVPHVVAAYRKYHDQGFEIVGVSLDQDKDAVQAFTAANGMTWPQYFDGQGWKNAISSGFGINSIPAMWLIDKRGMVVTRNGRDDLDGQVGRLLAAPSIFLTPRPAAGSGNDPGRPSARIRLGPPQMAPGERNEDQS